MGPAEQDGHSYKLNEDTPVQHTGRPAGGLRGSLLTCPAASTPFYPEGDRGRPQAAGGDQEHVLSRQAP